MATLTFYGAAQEVTGSCYLLESPAIGKVLLECGMHQGGDAIERLHEESFAFKARDIDAVILSHAHLDHSGMLPRLVREGFDGPIYCTTATRDLLKIMLKDSANLYLRDLERENLRLKRGGQKTVHAEYRMQDVNKVLKLCETTGYNKPVTIGHSQLRFHDAGHILGSSIVELTLAEDGRDKKLVFSGDLGNNDSVLMNNHTLLKQADIVLMEGTYGDRNHRSRPDTLNQLEEVLHSAWQQGGTVLIPSFAVGRTQEILFHLGCLFYQGKLDNWQVFLDSPMAIEVTKVYDRWIHLLSDDDIRCLNENDRYSLENFLPTLNLSITTEDSIAINRIKKGAIIIAGSGMCTGGRIRPHFRHRIWQKNTTVIFTGFQARGTLGRLLVDGIKKIRLFNEDIVVKARIETLGGLSAHAGQDALVNWAKSFENQPVMVLVHGEPNALDALAARLWKELGIKARIPLVGQSIAF
ncbi:MAG TPA: MBL fold metallo-hydrolase [Pseudomonadales bacterium]